MLSTLRSVILAAIFVLAFTTSGSLYASTIFTAVLSGANEVPPTGSPATGNATLTLTGDILTVNETFSGLTGGAATAAHIHCCGPIGVNEPVAVPFVNFPSATSGTYVMAFDLTISATYTGAFVTAKEERRHEQRPR